MGQFPSDIQVGGDHYKSDRDHRHLEPLIFLPAHGFGLFEVKCFKYLKRSADPRRSTELRERDLNKAAHVCAMWVEVLNPERFPAEHKLDCPKFQEFARHHRVNISILVFLYEEDPEAVITIIADMLKGSGLHSENDYVALAANARQAWRDGSLPH